MNTLFSDSRVVKVEITIPNDESKNISLSFTFEGMETMADAADTCTALDKCKQAIQQMVSEQMSSQYKYAKTLPQDKFEAYMKKTKLILKPTK